MLNYTDWFEPVKKVINDGSNLKALEFGLGEGTSLLCKYFKHVHSIEIVSDNDPTLPLWYNNVSNKLKTMNWSGEFYLYSEVELIDYNSNLSSKLKKTIDDIFIENWDFVLMDGGYHIRGDITNYIINKFNVKYIAIHDTNLNYLVDGYDRINIPDGYIVHKFTDGHGTHIFEKN